MGRSKIKVKFHLCFQSFTNCETLKAQVKLNLYCETLKAQVKLNLNFTRSQCDYLLIICRAVQGKIYINSIRYKRELRFECELQV